MSAAKVDQQISLQLQFYACMLHVAHNCRAMNLHKLWRTVSDILCIFSGSTVICVRVQCTVQATAPITFNFTQKPAFCYSNFILTILTEVQLINSVEMQAYM